MQRILVAVDWSPASDAVLAHAGDLARATGAALLVLHVADPEPELVGYDPGPQSVRDAVAGELREERRRLEEAARHLRERGIAEVEPVLRRGPTADTILETAERFAADVVVVGSRGHGAVLGMLLGSVSRALLRASKRPVVVVPAGT